MPDPARREVFRSRFNRGIAIVAWVLAAIIGGSVLFAPVSAWLLLAIPAAGAYLAWLVFWRPTVAVDDEGVELVNATYTVTVPWAALIQVETRYALTLRTPKRGYSATAAPAPGAMGTFHANRDFRMPKRGDAGQRPAQHSRPSDMARTDSGDASAMVVERWNELSDAGRIPLGEADATPVRLRVHVAGLVGAVVLVAAAATSLVVV
jgi:hypothetical protein